MVDYVGAHFKINYLSVDLSVCKILCFKCICPITLTFDLEGQGHILSNKLNTTNNLQDVIDLSAFHYNLDL